MTSEDFNRKVKLNVTAKFDQSFQIYQDFEDRYHLFADLAQRLAEFIGLQPGSSVLDVGCGSGISSIVLNERFDCRVLGVDLSPKMVAFGRSRIAAKDIRLLVGDGEQLAQVTGGALFDYVLYNASIFIFPDVARSLSSAWDCLRPGGKIAFSFYPLLVGPGEKDLLATAFERLGEPLPRFRVITGYDTACHALERQCGQVRRHAWQMPLNIDLITEFFSIPAQSASLFPGRDYRQRRELVIKLFAPFKDDCEDYGIVWRMAEGTKTNKNLS